MNEKIDFVVTWVDGNDLKWLEEKKKYEKNARLESNSIIRYRDWELTKYWFRSIEKFAPWVNNIFFVTYGHFPKWLDTSNKKLRIVKHSEFIPNELLPTYNSNTIEMYLNRIEGLEEKFVYFNDDQFLMEEVKPDDFYKKNMPKDALIFNAVSVSKENNIIEHTILNNLELVSKYYEKNKIRYCKIFNLKYGLNNIRNILLLPWKYYTRYIQSAYTNSSFKEYI